MPFVVPSPPPPFLHLFFLIRRKKWTSFHIAAPAAAPAAAAAAAAATSHKSTRGDGGRITIEPFSPSNFSSRPSAAAAAAAAANGASLKREGRKIAHVKPTHTERYIVSYRQEHPPFWHPVGSRPMSWLNSPSAVLQFKELAFSTI